MHRNILLPVLLLTMVTVNAAAAPYTVLEALLHTKEHDPQFHLLEQEYAVALLQAERAAIIARTELQRLQAADQETAARQEFFRKREDHFISALRVLFARHIAEIRVEIATIQRDREREALRQSELRYERGQVDVAAVLDARIASRESGIRMVEAQWQLDDALSAYIRSGHSDDRDHVFRYRPEYWAQPSQSLPVWLEQDTAILRARNHTRRVRVQYQGLPSNAPEFDAVLLTAQLAQAEAALQNAEEASERRHTVLWRQLHNSDELRSLRGQELELQQQRHQQAEDRFEQGLISLADRQNFRQQVLQARISLLQAEQQYGEALISLMFGYGIAMEEIE
ncbi:TolC family protein [Spirochaeta africana]|uniref:Outer membrane efflux protein n=1 Tax=Spirochaeta africana (strain ATCC 700263 / DSM 8902 / Z-7692) TaxID=889378 RepID=H9UM79_SPIAZ|nr:TolC family protein [Spirochaeta africana]AFG38622.1 Outer membrane efflux protein [Spirochaeta africana DSM 8902]